MIRAQGFRTATPWLMSLVGLASSRPAAAQTNVLTVVSHPFAAEGDAARLGPVVGEMLTVQWAGRGQRRVVPGTIACPDPTCGAENARRAGVQGALVGKIHRLAHKLALTAYWVRSDGTVIASAMATADDESGLPDATRLLAKDLEQSAVASTPPSAALAPNPRTVNGTPPVSAVGPMVEARPPSAALGESIPPEQESHHVFPVLRLGYVHSLSGTLPSVGSLSGELSVAFGQGLLLIEPRIALRRSFDRDDEWYAEVPMDIGLYVRWPHGDIYPLLGGGIGGHYLMMQRATVSTEGEVGHRATTIGSVFAFGGFARAGFGARPSRSTTIFLTGDLEATTGDLFGKSPHWLTTLNLGFGFGG